VSLCGLRAEADARRRLSPQLPEAPRLFDGKSEIANEDVTVLVQKEVLGLEIAVFVVVVVVVCVGVGGGRRESTRPYETMLRRYPRQQASCIAPINVAELVNGL
jgi:hypothetical protein